MMKSFSIRQLEKFSGIKAHTLRMWERRYGLFNPERNHAQVRRYSTADLGLLLDISILLKNKYRISRLAVMGTPELKQCIDKLQREDALCDKAVAGLIRSMFETEIGVFENILDESLDRLGVKTTIQSIIIPFIEKVQILSYNESTNEVHLAVTAVRRKIILGIEQARPEQCIDKTALLFLPKGEHYDLILLYLDFILRNMGIKVVYLGTNISRENLESMAGTKKPDYLFTYVPQKQKFSMPYLPGYLQQHLPQAKLFVVESDKKHDSIHEKGNTTFLHYDHLPWINLADN